MVVSVLTHIPGGAGHLNWCWSFSYRNSPSPGRWPGRWCTPRRLLPASLGGSFDPLGGPRGRGQPGIPEESSRHARRHQSDRRSTDLGVRGFCGWGFSLVLRGDTGFRRLGAEPRFGGAIWRGHPLPLLVVEASHFATGLIGVTLLFSAYGLFRHMRSAYWLAVFSVGRRQSLLVVSGVHYWGAIVLVAMLGCFCRRGSIFAAAVRRFGSRFLRDGSRRSC